MASLLSGRSTVSKRRSRIAVAIASALLVVGLAGGVSDAAPLGTGIGATTTATGHLWRTYGWTLSKSVTPGTLTLSSGDSDTVTYTVGATKDTGRLAAYFEGDICVTNEGEVATQGLAITDNLSAPPSKVLLAWINVSVAAKPVLQPDETYCYPYRIHLYSDVWPGASYKDTARVTITNKSGLGSGPTPSASAPLPATVEAEQNGGLSVADTNGSTYSFSMTGTTQYSKTFTCDADGGTNANVVSAVGFVSTPAVPAPASQTASVEVTCLAPDVAAEMEADVSSAEPGDTVTWAVTIANLGLGEAFATTLTDSLPAGIAWSIDDNTTDFELVGSSLMLKNQPVTLESGASRTVHLSGLVTEDLCESTLTNSAAVSATNEAVAEGGNNSSTASVTVECALAEIVLHKTDDAGNALAGATFGRFGSAADAASESNPMATCLTDAGGLCTLTDVDPGTYYVTEITAPAGYDEDPTVVPVQVGSHATVEINQSFVDPRHGGYVAVLKTLVDQAGGRIVPPDLSVLNGATFIVYKDVSGSGALDPGEEAHLWPNPPSGATDIATCTITNSLGFCLIGPLATGTYRIHETISPAGSTWAGDVNLTITHTTAQSPNLVIVRNIVSMGQ